MDEWKYYLAYAEHLPLCIAALLDAKQKGKQHMDATLSLLLEPTYRIQAYTSCLDALSSHQPSEL
jgi:hypothetical protein